VKAAPFRVTVYASSSERIDPGFMPVATELGRQIAVRGWELVWGGGRYGLMGAVSRGVREAGGRTIGVILQDFIDNDVHCEAAHEMASVDDMRLRKRGLSERGDAFIALPGGFGTLEEVLEILSFKQLGLHDKPVVFLDALGYWRPLLAALEHGFAAGFMPQDCRGMYGVADDPAAAIEVIESLSSWRRGEIDELGGGSC